MSGHSKWANIKNRKGVADKKRSESFTKMAKMIMTAIRMDGGNTNVGGNSYLRAAVDKARAVNMPKENIERILSRFENRKANLANYLFEGFAKGGVPVVVEVESDNKNRILSEVRLIFRDHEANLGEEGSVAYLFERLGRLEIDRIMSEDEELELIDAGVSDIKPQLVWTDVTKMGEIRRLLESMGHQVIKATVVMKPKSPTKIDKATHDQLLDLIEDLEENDEVVEVYSGCSFNE